MTGEMTHTIETESGQRELEVHFEYIAGSKERRYGHPDDWHAAEGPEVYVRWVRDEHGAEMPDKDWQELVDEDTLIEAIIEYMEDEHED